MREIPTRRQFTAGIAAVAAASLAGRRASVAAIAADAPLPAAPVAPALRTTFAAFGRERVDEYDWLRDRSDPRVVAYLEAENAYADAHLKPIKPLVEELAAELKARSAQADASVPTLINGYLYERRFGEGTQYPIIVRRRATPGAEEEVVLDVGALAARHSQQCHFGAWAVSPDNTRVAFTVDFSGDREFRIFVRAIAGGDVVDQGIDSAASNIEFAADNRTLFYVRNEPQTLRAYQVWRHRVGSAASNDVLVYEEHDPTFSVSLDLSKSRKFILLDLDAERWREFRYLPVDQPAGEFRIIEPRRRGLVYEAEHVGDKFFIRTNLDAPDFRLMCTSESAPAAAHWREIVPQQAGKYLHHFEAFETFVAADFEDESGTTVRVYSLPDAREIALPRPAAIGVASTSFSNDCEANLDPAATVLRFRFSGLLEPQRIYDFDVTTGALTLRKEDAASRWFNGARYAVDRISATAPDGEHIPLTIIYRKSARRLGGNPTLVVGYGAYGISWRATFAPSVFSLLDRGFIYAIAHVRGGHEKGERWYAEGRMLNKRNTFTDFIAATEALTANGYAAPCRVYAQGGSAGGLLMGAIANMRPDLYAGIVAEAPFVDVVTTMSDAAVPLTTLEYDEWGNPAVKREFEYMLSYSPYDNVAPTDYPAMFITAGFYDSQVSYAEPAKWVARLRATKSDARDLLFKTDMEAGHVGRSGRLGSIEESAEIMAWLIAHAHDGRLP
jgi:oligopeptidase B